MGVAGDVRMEDRWTAQGGKISEGEPTANGKKRGHIQLHAGPKNQKPNFRRQVTYDDAGLIRLQDVAASLPATRYNKRLVKKAEMSTAVEHQHTADSEAAKALAYQSTFADALDLEQRASYDMGRKNDREGLSPTKTRGPVERLETSMPFRLTDQEGKVSRGAKTWDACTRPMVSRQLVEQQWRGKKDVRQGIFAAKLSSDPGGHLELGISARMNSFERRDNLKQNLDVLFEQASPFVPRKARSSRASTRGISESRGALNQRQELFPGDRGFDFAGNIQENSESECDLPSFVRTVKKRRNRVIEDDGEWSREVSEAGPNKGDVSTEKEPKRDKMLPAASKENPEGSNSARWAMHNAASSTKRRPTTSSVAGNKLEGLLSENLKGSRDENRLKQKSLDQVYEAAVATHNVVRGTKGFSSIGPSNFCKKPIEEEPRSLLNCSGAQSSLRMHVGGPDAHKWFKRKNQKNDITRTTSPLGLNGGQASAKVAKRLNRHFCSIDKESLRQTASENSPAEASTSHSAHDSSRHPRPREAERCVQPLGFEHSNATRMPSLNLNLTPDSDPESESTRMSNKSLEALRCSVLAAEQTNVNQAQSKKLPTKSSNGMAEPQEKSVDPLKDVRCSPPPLSRGGVLEAAILVEQAIAKLKTGRLAILSQGSPEQASNITLALQLAHQLLISVGEDAK